MSAWVLVSSRFRGFDAQVRPDLRGGQLEREVLEFAGARTAELMRRHNIGSDFMLADAFRCDTTRV